MAAKLANKAISWRTSWEARVCVAILNFNEGHSWKLRVFDHLAAMFGWRDLPERCRARLEADFAAASAQAASATAHQAEANAQIFERRHPQHLSLRDARAQGLPLHAYAHEDPVDPFEVNEMGTCPLSHGFLNDGLICHLNSLLAVMSRSEIL